MCVHVCVESSLQDEQFLLLVINMTNNRLSLTAEPWYYLSFAHSYLYILSQHTQMTLLTQEASHKGQTACIRRLLTTNMLPHWSPLGFSFLFLWRPEVTAGYKQRPGASKDLCSRTLQQSRGEGLNSILADVNRALRHLLTKSQQRPSCSWQSHVENV